MTVCLSVLSQPAPILEAVLFSGTVCIPVRDRITQGRASVLGVVWIGIVILADYWSREQGCIGPT